MGGTLLQYQQRQQSEKVEKHLHTVKYYVTELGNYSLFNSDKFYANLTKKIEKKLDSLGIDYKHIPRDGFGAGFSSFWDILSFFWENRDVITLITSLSTYVGSVYNAYMENTVSNTKPLIMVNLSIESNAVIDMLENKEIDFIVSSRLANLIILAENLEKLLANEFVDFRLNFSIDVKLHAQNTNISFYLQRVLSSKLNKHRMLRIIKDLKVKRGYHTEYSVLPFGLIKREDFKVKYYKDDYYLVKMLPYYFFFSTRVISDYKSN